MDEFARLNDLYNLQILDSNPEKKFDELTLIKIGNGLSPFMAWKSEKP